MTFTLKHPDGPADEYGDEDTYEFLNDGVLKVRVSSTGKTYYFPTGVWKTLIAGNGHEPGLRLAP
jgi:hypothetical protein